jgi:hypothetical protein
MFTNVIVTVAGRGQTATQRLTSAPTMMFASTAAFARTLAVAQCNYPKFDHFSLSFFTDYSV